jgi:hypothetical protein
LKSRAWTFRWRRLGGGLGIAFNPTKPWIIQARNEARPVQHVTDGDVLDSYLLVEYTLS